MLELEIDLEEQHAEAEAKVFESAGGYAPTIGIIGAVLGLIQVMKNLANIDEVGHGIAVAFVATVYGVGSANLLFLPAATKIKARDPRRDAAQGTDSGGGVGNRRGPESEADSRRSCEALRARKGWPGGRQESRSKISRRKRRSSRRRRPKSRPRSMARKKKHRNTKNHERWLVSYADFITLLFAFFVVMFATSQTDKGKAQQVSDSVKKALGRREDVRR